MSTRQESPCLEQFGVCDPGSSEDLPLPAHLAARAAITDTTTTGGRETANGTTTTHVEVSLPHFLMVSLLMQHRMPLPAFRSRRLHRFGCKFSEEGSQHAQLDNHIAQNVLSEGDDSIGGDCQQHCSASSNWYRPFTGIGPYFCSDFQANPPFGGSITDASGHISIM